MAQEVVSFGDIVPDQLKVKPLVTGAGRVARKTRREFLPVSGSIFSPSSTPYVEFHLSSAKDFLIPSEVYLRFEMWGTIVNDASLAYQTYLTENGVHSCFERLELSDRAGRTIESIQHYDHVSKIVSCAYEDKESKHQSGWAEGRLPGVTGSPYYFEYPPKNSMIEEVGLGANVGDTLTLSSGLPGFTGKVLSGALLRIGNQSTAFFAVVQSVSSNTVCTLIDAPYNAPANSVVSIVHTSNELPVYVDPLNPKTREFTMRIKTGIFEMKEDLPLFLMDGLQVRLYFNQAFKALVTPNTFPAAGTSWTASYSMKNMRMIAHLRTPSSEVRSQYLSMFENGMLNYGYLSYYTSKKSISGSLLNAELDLPVSKSSLKKVFMVMQSDIEESPDISGGAQENFSISNSSYRYLDGYLSQYQFKIGSSDYPNQPIDISSIYGTDAYNDFLVACVRHGDKVTSPGIGFEDWVAVNRSFNITSKPTQSYNRIYATRFDTVEDDILSGIKTRGPGADDHIVARLKFSDTMQYNLGAGDVTSNRYVYFVFEHSRVLHVSSGGILSLD